MLKQCPNCNKAIDHLNVTYWQSEWTKHSCETDENGELDYDNDEIIDYGDSGNDEDYEFLCPLCGKQITGSQCSDTIWEMLKNVNTKKKDFINNLASTDA